VLTLKQQAGRISADDLEMIDGLLVTLERKRSDGIGSPP
jgi:hypothetical protein